MTLVLIGVGGAVGAVLRHLLGRLNHVRSSDGPAPRSLPVGTLVANLVGSLLLGVLMGATDDPTLRAALGTGLLGGLTTFSTLAVELAARPPRVALGYGAVTVLGGLLAAAAGLSLGRQLTG